ncbi:MAG: YfcC family protein, partial [Saprospiraceae bacterium]
MAKKWYHYIPHPVVMLFTMLVMASVMSYIVPAGAFDRAEIGGINRVVAGSYKVITSTPLSLMDMFLAIPLGFKTAIDIIFIVLASGIMFGFMEASGAIENSVGTLVKSLGLERKYLIVVIMTFVFGSLGVFIGYENNIAMVPIACILSLAIGGDLMLAAGISVGAITVGFGLSPVNPYTVGTGHRIAELPLFSGSLYRSIICMTGLSLLAWYNIKYFKSITANITNGLSDGLDTHGFTLSRPLDEYKMSAKDKMVMISFLIAVLVILYGAYELHWFINQISAIFCMLAIVIGLINKNNGQQFGEIILKSVAVVAPGAFMVGMATSIKVALDMGNISDTIAYTLSSALMGLPVFV